MEKSSIVQIPDGELIAVPKEFFVDGLILTANVYLQVKANHYIIIGKKNSPSAISDYHATTRNDAVLYVHSSEYSLTMNNNFSFTEKIVSTAQIPSSTKIKYINALSETIIDDLYNLGVGVESIESLKRLGSLVQNTISGVDSIHDILKSLENLPHNMAKHAMSTAYLSLMIAAEMNITYKSALEKLVLGALVHDIGLREIPKEILEKPRLAWSEQELQYYESHTLRGLEILREIPQISYDVLLIVNEHHENAFGTGFPQRIRDIKINPLARIVAIADYTTDLLYGNFLVDKEKSLDTIVSYIQDVMGQPFNKQVFLALKSLPNKQYLINKMRA